MAILLLFELPYDLFTKSLAFSVVVDLTTPEACCVVVPVVPVFVVPVEPVLVLVLFG